MSRKKETRNQEIYERMKLFKSNTPSNIAKEYNITKTRLFQIIRAIEKERLTKKQ